MRNGIRFVAHLKRGQIAINRKMLAHLATIDPKVFAGLSDSTKTPPSQKRAWFEEWEKTGK
jgi:ribosomal protein L20